MSKVYGTTSDGHLVDFKLDGEGKVILGGESLEAIREIVQNENVKALNIMNKHINELHIISVEHITESLKVLDRRLTEVIKHEQ